MVNVDLPNRAQKAPEFLKKNPYGEVPVLEDGDVTLAESNAILVYLAMKYDASERWLPRDALGAARVTRWLSLATGPLAQGPCMARVHHVLGRPVDMERARALSAQLFGVVEEQVSRTPFLVGSEPTIADLAFYAYTARAPEGQISLEPYPQLRAWLERIEALPGFAPMMHAAPRS
jgi:glutathione S-transferase